MATVNSENSQQNDFQTTQYSFPTQPIERLSYQDPKADELIRSGVCTFRGNIHTGTPLFTVREWGDPQTP